MGRPARSTALAACAAALVAAGCGSAGSGELALGCTDRAQVERSLAKAPATVRLTSGTLLSDCMGPTISDADLQSVGLVYHEVAEALRVRATAGDSAAATQLGYLVGATAKGSAGTNGVMAELDRRVSLVGGRFVDDAAPAQQAALERGLAAGTARG